MPSAEVRAAAAEIRRPRRTGRGVFWVMLASLIILAATTAVAMSGWNTAIHRADEQTARAIALQATADQATVLQQKITAIQKNVTDAGAREHALQVQLADSTTSLTGARNKVTAAEGQAVAAEKAASDAERIRADLQA